MLGALCAVCGSPAEIESWCEAHWLKRQELFSIREFRMQICDRCSRWFDGRWHPPAESAAGAVQAAVLHHIKPSGQAEVPRIDVGVKVPESFRPGKAIASIKVCGTVAPSKEEIRREKELGILVKWAYCEDCIRLSGNYHEAIMQLRGERQTEALKAAEELLRGKTYSMRRIREGFNLFLVRKAAASKAAKQLRDAGFDVLRTSKLVGEKKGDRLYRDVYAIR